MNKKTNCNYPENDSVTEITQFIAKWFTHDGVKCFYGLNNQFGARNNLTIENFKEIYNVNRGSVPLQLTNVKGEVKPFEPVPLNSSLLIGINMNH